MRAVQYMRAFVVMTLLPLGCSEGVSEPADAAVVQAGAIQGTVRTVDGAAVEGARVSTTPATEAASTDAEGRFTITDVVPGTYVVAAASEGYFEAQVMDVVVAANQTTDVELELEAEPEPGATCVTCHMDLDRLYASLEEDPIEGRPHEGGSAGEG